MKDRSISPTNTQLALIEYSFQITTPRSDMKRKRVIVTGGLGFIGSHLVEKLVEDNEVVIIDNKSTGKLENVSHLTCDNLKVIEGDVTILDLATIFEGYDY